MDTNSLHQTLLFQRMSDDEIRLCLATLYASEKKFRKGQIIFHAGDLTDRM